MADLSKQINELVAKSGSTSITIRTSFSAPQYLSGLSRFITALLEDPTLMQRIVKAVMRETLIRAFQARFIAGANIAKDMKRVSSLAISLTLQERVRDQIRKLDARISEAITQEAQDRLRERRSALLVQLVAETTTFTGGGGDPSGRLFSTKFGPVIYRLQAALFGNFIQTSTEGGKLELGVGNIPFLDRSPKLKTPDVQEDEDGVTTTSPHKIAWRHLEFGTGVFAKGQFQGHPGNRTKTGSGSWWLGPVVGQGLHLLGSEPGNFVRSVTGAPYQSDALAFTRVFNESMLNEIRKRQ